MEGLEEEAHQEIGAEGLVEHPEERGGPAPSGGSEDQGLCLLCHVRTGAGPSGWLLGRVEHGARKPAGAEGRGRGGFFGIITQTPTRVILGLQNWSSGWIVGLPPFRIQTPPAPPHFWSRASTSQPG